MEQVVELVTARIDDAQPIAREMIGIECSDENAYYHADGQQDGHETIVFFVIHSVSLLRYNVIFAILQDKRLRFLHAPTGRCRLSDGIARHRRHA